MKAVIRELERKKGKKQAFTMYISGSKDAIYLEYGSLYRFFIENLAEEV